MLTGYNTDVSYGGVLFHVQTEDKGINSPIILSLVYRAGTILVAKRTPYSNLIQDGMVDEAALAQILTRQHQILVAAIQAGKSDKLVELSRNQVEKKGKESASASPDSFKSEAEVKIQPIAASVNVSVSASIHPEKPKSQHLNLPQVSSVTPQPSAPIHKEKRVAGGAVTFDQIVTGYLQKEDYAEKPRLELLYPSKFRSGDEVTVRAAVFMGGHKPAPNAEVQLQVLGTKIKPQVWNAHTDALGLVSFQVKIPVFTAGAAALIIKATAQNGQDVESKYLISIN